MRNTILFEVERGLDCGCICPSCNMRLIANKGHRRRHYFSHERNNECLYGADIAIYQAMYELLRNSKRLFMPDVTLSVGYYEEKVIKQGYMQTLTDVKFYNDPVNYPPELYCYVGENKLRVILNIESYYDICDIVSIKEYAKQKDIPIVVIDIDDAEDASSFEDLQKYIDLPDSKRWIYNRYAEREKQRLIEIAAQRKKNNQSHLNKMCTENIHEREKCSFATRRMNTSELVRKEEQEALLVKKGKSSVKIESVAGTPFYGICPRCGKKLKEMPSKNGKAYMCVHGCKIYRYRDSKTGEIIDR